MPTASDAQVPKPLTYTLMYHFLWCVLFLLSALTLMGVFLASGRSWTLTLLPPMALVALALIAGAGAFATYAIRIEVLLGNVSKEEAFRWSSRSSWAVLILAPLLFAVWQFALEPLARMQWSNGQLWPVPVEMTIVVAKVEVVVWWLSHLLSVRGLSRGRKTYFGTPPATALSHG